MLDKGLSRLGEGGIGVFDEASGDCVFGGSLEDLGKLLHLGSRRKDQEDLQRGFQFQG